MIPATVLLISGGAAVLALATALSSADPATLGPLPVAQAEIVMQASGKAIFEGKGNCATCHGKDARGTPLGPDLTDGRWLNITGTLEEITATVRAGITKPKQYSVPMPPMGGARLRSEEIDAVSRYVLGLNPTRAAPREPQPPGAVEKE